LTDILSAGLSEILSKGLSEVLPEILPGTLPSSGLHGGAPLRRRGGTARRLRRHWPRRRRGRRPRPRYQAGNVAGRRPVGHTGAPDKRVRPHHTGCDHLAQPLIRIWTGLLAANCGVPLAISHEFPPTHSPRDEAAALPLSRDFRPTGVILITDDAESDNVATPAR
jgi:hypothetical protein